MSENKFSGTVDDIKGKVQDAAGGLTGDTSTQVRGKANQVGGSEPRIEAQACQLADPFGR